MAVTAIKLPGRILEFVMPFPFKASNKARLAFNGPYLVRTAPKGLSGPRLLCRDLSQDRRLIHIATIQVRNPQSPD
jgi:hypothetical protein